MEKYNSHISELKTRSEKLTTKDPVGQVSLSDVIAKAIEDIFSQDENKDEFYKGITDKIIIKSKTEIDVYLKYAPHKWSFSKPS